MGLSINKINDVALSMLATQNDANKNGKLEKNEYNLFQQQAQHMLENGTVTEENYLQAVKQYHSGVIGWFKDDSMVCKDTKDDGKIGLGQAALNVGEGLVGGIVKAVVQHPIKSAIAIGAGIGATVLTGGAILPVMVGIGLAAGTGVTVAGVVQASKATNDGDKKKAFENVGTGIATIILSVLGLKKANKVAADAGVKTLQGLEDASLLQNAKAGVKATPEIFKVSGLNAKGNALTWMSAIKGDKIIYANSNETRTGVMVGKQSGNPVEDAYKVDLKGSVEEVLAKNPELSYDAEAGKFYVQTSWGSKSYIQSDNYMVLKYGPGDNNAVEGLEFYDTYIDQAAREATGKNIYINPEKLQPGQHVYTAKEAPARFKVVPEGTKYVGAETKAGEVDVVQSGSVLRIDGQGRPYQSKVDWMLKKVTLTDEQIGALVKADPKLAASTPKGQAYMFANDPQKLIVQNPKAYIEQQGIKILDVTEVGGKNGGIDAYTWEFNGNTYHTNVRSFGTYDDPEKVFATNVYKTINNIN